MYSSEVYEEGLEVFFFKDFCIANNIKYTKENELSLWDEYSGLYMDFCISNKFEFFAPDSLVF